MPNPLDDWMPAFDVRERYAVRVHAPAALVYQTACDFDMQSIGIVKGIFWLRGKMMRAANVQRAPRGLIDELQTLGWGRLIERPGELYVGGAVCQPWLADVVFESIAPERFPSFAPPDRVKIAWTIECQARGANLTDLVSETRAVATDATARARFIPYWRWARFGIYSIRWVLLPAVRKQAEADYRRGAGMQT